MPDMDMNRMIITDENGQDKEVEIILTFEDDNTGRSFVLFTDPDDEEGNVFAYTYDEDGNLNEVESEEDWNMCAEVLGAFQSEDDGDEE